jgi:Trypsin-like peptidase domain
MLERLKGAVAMYGDNVCSGALVTFTGRRSSAPALVLSAAHCSNRGKAQIQLKKGSLAALDAGEVLYRAEYRRPLTLDTGKSDEPRSCVQAEEIVYGTLTGGDIMLLRLSETYDEIERRTSVKPFVVSQDTSFPAGLALRMPSSFWQNDRACAIDGVAEKVKEFRWSWGPVLRLRLDVDTCLFPHGASGSPAIRTDTNEVIGVAGTASDGDGGPCELNNPCEVNAGGSTRVAAKDQAYVHFVHQFYSCLDGARDVDLAVPGCTLPRPR